MYILTQHNKPGEAPYTWDNAIGPLFICGPCYTHLKDAPWRASSGQYLANIYGSNPTYGGLSSPAAFAQGYGVVAAPFPENDEPPF
jgi:hypothetical protein